MGKQDFRIEKYLKYLAEGKITVSQISRDEGVSRDTIYRRIKDYCKDNEVENIYYVTINGRRKTYIDMSKYIEKLKNGRITKAEIAREIGLSVHIVNQRVKEYLEENNEEMIDFRKVITKVDISKYIENLNAGKITQADIRRKEGVSKAILTARIKDYYDEIGEQRPKFKAGRKKTVPEKSSRKPLNVEEYIEDYSIGFINQSGIAKKSGITISGVSKAISRYYVRKIGENNLFKSTTFDIKKYIKEYESGAITPHQIAIHEKIDIKKVNEEIENYYINQNKKPPKYGVPESVILEYLEKGLSKEQIKAIAAKKNLIIPDAAFERVEKKLEGHEGK